MDYIAKLRKHIGHETILLPGSRIILLNSKNQVLLQKRSDFNIWGLPSGSPEENESILDCIKREVYEETGFILASAEVYGYASHPDTETIRYPNKDKIQNFSLLFYSKDFTGSMIDGNEESLELKWFDFNNLPEIIQNHKKTVMAYLRFLENKEFQLI